MTITSVVGLVSTTSPACFRLDRSAWATSQGSSASAMGCCASATVIRPDANEKVALSTTVSKKRRPTPIFWHSNIWNGVWLVTLCRRGSGMSAGLRLRSALGERSID